MKGHLILIVGPSGSGKGSLIAHLRKEFPKLPFALSCTTRAPRPDEAAGDVYHFITSEEFRARIERGDFLEWATFGGHMYGVLKSEVLHPMERGEVVLREVEVQGARSLQKFFPKKNLTTIFLDSGDWADLEKRIIARAPITKEELEKRHERFNEEQSFLNDADYVLHNRSGELEAAKAEITRIVTSIIEPYLRAG